MVASKASKKTANKKASKKTAKVDRPDPSEVKVPEGFKAISGAFAPTWAPNENEGQPGEITGIWGKERIVQIRRGRGMQDNRVCTIQTDNEAYTIWCSAGLVPLFDSAEEGDEVYIRYDGLGKAKGKQNPPKLYTTAIAE